MMVDGQQRQQLHRQEPNYTEHQRTSEYEYGFAPMSVGNQNQDQAQHPPPNPEVESFFSGFGVS